MLIYSVGTNKRHALLSALLSWSRESAGAALCAFILAKVTLSSRTEASKITKKTHCLMSLTVFDVPTNHKDQPLFCHPGPEMDICLIYCVCTCVCVCFLFSGCALRNRIPGMCNHRRPLHHSHAHRRAHLSLLPLLRQLWREDVPEADIVHPLSQENALLGFIHHHHHHPVSLPETHGPALPSLGGN